MSVSSKWEKGMWWRRFSIITTPLAAGTQGSQPLSWDPSFCSRCWGWGHVAVDIMRHFKRINPAWFQATGFDQWSSNLSVRTSWRAFYNTNHWVPILEFLIQSVWGWGPRIYISHKFGMMLDQTLRFTALDKP